MDKEQIAKVMGLLKGQGIDFTKAARGRITLELTWRERFSALFKGTIEYHQTFDEAKQAVAGFEDSFNGMGVEFEPYVSEYAKPTAGKSAKQAGASGSIGFLKE